MRLLSILAALLLFSLPAVPQASAETRLILASTTSTQNTGLFDVLLPAYYKWTKHGGVRIDVVAVGTGKALEIARRGDADILLVHDREREDAFVAEGYGVGRRDVMYNDFVIVGPKDDPAGASSASDAARAMTRIAASGSVFVSRGDDSGTHSREKKLWEAAGVKVGSIANYLSVGQGMEATLRIADERIAYTLSDRATYLSAFESLKNVGVLLEGDPVLFNQYGVIAVDPKRFPHAKYDLAMDFIEFITGTEGQKVIGEFRGPRGEALFVPNAK